MRILQSLCLGLACLLAASAWAAPGGATQNSTSPSGIAARAWILIDPSSGRELAAHQADLPLAPASLTQLMTAYVLLGDIRKNKLSLGETVNVPEAATRADGARVFLQAGEQVSVDTLFQAMLVQSASDAVLTLVTATDGSEAAFVVRMNQAAKRLGMTRTRFMNATGLTEPGHESSARDLAVLSRALLRDFPERLAFFSQQEMAFKGVHYYNGNRLLWRDRTVNGLKVGRTVQAGYCMAASAQRGNQRRVAIVLGEHSDAQRTQDALKLLNHGFENYDSVLLYRARQPVKQLALYRGQSETVAIGFAQDFHLLIPQGSAARLQAQIISQKPVLAPVNKGQPMGSLRLTLDGRTLGDYPLVALQGVGLADFFGRSRDSLRLLLGR